MMFLITQKLRIHLEIIHRHHQDERVNRVGFNHLDVSKNELTNKKINEWQSSTCFAL